jgi:hypothetical protein
MTDAVIIKHGTLKNDGTEQVEIPVKYISNGDGTYSEQGGGGGGGDASAANQVAQTTHLVNIETAVGQIGVTRYVAISNWVSKIAFTGVASAGLTIQNFRVIDLSTSSTVSSVWTNLATGLDLASPPVVDTEIEYIGGTAITLAEMQSLDTATQTTLAAVLTELQLKADLTETQPVSISQTLAVTATVTPFFVEYFDDGNSLDWKTIGQESLVLTVEGSRFIQVSMVVRSIAGDTAVTTAPTLQLYGEVDSNYGWFPLGDPIVGVIGQATILNLANIACSNVKVVVVVAGVGGGTGLNGENLGRLQVRAWS